MDRLRLEESFAGAGLLGDAAPTGPRTLTGCQAEQFAAELGLPLREVEGFALDCEIVPQRYAMNIGCFTIAGQKKLLGSRVLVVGLGGLGGHVVEQLARAGVGRIAAADPDVFEETNLNRQIFSTTAGLGCKKTTETARRLTQINPAVEFSGYDVKFQQLDDAVFDGLDLVFDCLDGAADRCALETICSARDIVLIHGAIGGWFGQVGIVWPGAGLLKRTYGDHKHGIEQTLGNPPFTPAVIGSMAAALGIRFLLGKVTARESSLHFIDLVDEECQSLRFPDAGRP